MTGIDLDQFPQWLDKEAQRIGAHSIACIRMDNPRLRDCLEQSARMTAPWLAAGQHGEMEYLGRMSLAKADPWKTFPFARSVLIATFTNQWGDPAATHPFPVPVDGALLGYVSAYARSIDYHRIGRGLLTQLAAQLGPDVRTEITVDTGPVDERMFAVAGGLGVIGGNGLLRVHGDPSVRVFIGCLFTDADLPEVVFDPVLPFLCDDCRACVTACPSGALTFGAPIDARRCISYLTIEKRGLLTQNEAGQIGNWIFGCDACTTACPSFGPVDARIPVDLEWLLKTPTGKLRRLWATSAVAYAGVTQLRRNAVAVLKNMKSSRADELLLWVRGNSGSDLIRAQIDLW